MDEQNILEIFLSKLNEMMQIAKAIEESSRLLPKFKNM